jgi:hypothetical protein
MDGPLSTKSADCRRGRGPHATSPGRQKFPLRRWESVVLSGFPTAGEPSLSGRICPGKAPRALRSDWKGNQLPLPRDGIPPQFRLSRSEFSASAWPGCALRVLYVQCRRRNA